MMISWTYRAVYIVVFVLLIQVYPGLGQTVDSVQLPEPQLNIGRPLMQVLKDRKTSREFSTEPLPAQVLSNLLWAACGVNRQESGKRTAPSAVNWQEIDVYVAMADGLYLYDAKAHRLTLILQENIRALTGVQPFVKEVPVNLIYVADFSRMGNAEESDKEFYSSADTGFISENVYLFCASEGLATVVRGLIDRATLAKAMGLRSDQRIILAQSVGYPKNKAVPDNNF
jgi:SagB-type dehydrogenase family enzyme